MGRGGLQILSLSLTLTLIRWGGEAYRSARHVQKHGHGLDEVVLYPIRVRVRVRVRDGLDEVVL